jgi:hypothetical protein
MMPKIFIDHGYFVLISFFLSPIRLIVFRLYLILALGDILIEGHLEGHCTKMKQIFHMKESNNCFSGRRMVSYTHWTGFMEGPWRCPYSLCFSSSYMSAGVFGLSQGSESWSNGWSESMI